MLVLVPNRPYLKSVNHTCRRPFSSLSPRSFTNTISSKERRTRSKGSVTAATSPSVASAIPNSLWTVFHVLLLYLHFAGKQSTFVRNWCAQRRQFYATFSKSYLLSHSPFLFCRYSIRTLDRRSKVRSIDSSNGAFSEYKFSCCIGARTPSG